MDIDKLNQIKSECDKTKKYLIYSIIATFAIMIVLVLWTSGIIINRSLTSANTVIFRIIGPTIGLTMSAMGVIAIVLFLRYSKQSKEYRLAYKLHFSKISLSGVLEKYIYYPNLGIEKDALDSLNCIRFGNIYKSEDLVIGERKNVQICQADMLIRYESDEEQSRTYFKGIWTVADYPKKFESKLIIVGKRLQHLIKQPAGFHATEVESPDFNKRFNIYAKDGREMFYLLNPKIIERMQSLAERSSNYIVFIFDNQKLHIGISAPDSFEPNFAKGPIDEKEEVKRLSQEALLIAKLIDELELDRKIFLK